MTPETITKKSTLADQICDMIRRDLMMRRYKPGEKINLKEMCAHYNVSETPVRIALNRLTAENMIEIFPRQGMRFKALDIPTCEETFDLRLMLELYCAHDMTIAVNLDRSLRVALEQNIVEFTEQIQKLNPDSNLDNYIEVYRYDQEFHELLLQSAGNKLLMQVYHNLNPFLYTNYIFARQSKKRLMTGANEHRAILDALLRGDEELVKSMLSNHIMTAKASIIKILKISGMEYSTSAESEE